ncbi:MAG TPA: glutathione S-transferase N-terminal domain-containing protein [Rhodospirillales bacterium]|jgi:glutathione S-transferase|nr:glutathione S-transferase N-terminal domain-containing protein [Rhodospirillales bacterium]
MKLRYSLASPYARKVTVTAIETGLEDQLEKILSKPFDANTKIGDVNPLGKIPALILDDGQVLYDSPVICEYLDSLHDGDKLFPASGDARWRALKLQALGDGMTDAGVACRMEGLRPEEFQYDKWVRRQTAVIFRSMDALENGMDALEGPLSIGHVAIACSIGWLEFRLSDLNWRGERPGLAAWFEDFSDRPSMIQTAPSDG